MRTDPICKLVGHAKTRSRRALQPAWPYPIVGVLAGEEHAIAERSLHVRQHSSALIAEWGAHDCTRQFVAGARFNSGQIAGKGGVLGEV